MWAVFYGQRKRVLLILLLIAMFQVTSIAGRVLLPHESQDQLHHLKSSKEMKGAKRGEGDLEHGDGSEGLTTLGSRPPSCEHKCGGCVPCVAIQVPTTTGTDRIGVQYANYEPEGWKCKCGSAFFNP